MLKGQYVKNIFTKEENKIEIGELEEHSKISYIKIFSPDMSHSYWVEKSDYELAVLENIEVECIVKN